MYIDIAADHKQKRSLTETLFSTVTFAVKQELWIQQNCFMLFFSYFKIHYKIHYIKYNHKSSDETRHELEVVESERDLGVVISSNLKWHNHIVKIVSQANKMIQILFNAFKSREKDLVLTLSYIRPQVEFAQPVWSPYLKKDIDKL